MKPKSTETLSIIPKPIKMDVKQGHFKLNNNSIIVADPSLKKLAEYFKKLIAPATEFELAIKDLTKYNAESNTIILSIEENENLKNREGYLLQVDQKTIKIIGPTPQGVFYGIQTLRQLLPTEIESSSKVIMEWSIPCVIIKDFPRFSWRGFMLDESRHFFGMDLVKKLLDIMASLKLNVFHWHLTYDQGWRIEIKKYPLLTEIGSKRRGTIKARKKIDNIPISGYYTQEEIRKVIKYAAEKFITIIPEIDVPGHVTAALAAYPELSCTGGPFEVCTHFGILKDVLCIGKEKVFEFVQDALKEVMELFTSKIIHIGGDEVPRVRWKECSDCQARIQKEGFSSVGDLQVYFTNRITEFLASNGHRLMGWNEILDENLAKNAICQFWENNLDEVVDHMRKGRDTVISERVALYLNYRYDLIPLFKTYHYEPVPKELEPDYHENVLGIESCVWTEYIKNIKDLEWKVFPRLLAVAETGWTPKNQRGFESFLTRLNAFLERLKLQKINFATEDEYRKYEKTSQ